MFVIRRAVGAGREGGANSGLVLSAVRTLLKVGIWVAAVAMILSALGFDVTAIVAGLGIGGLAVGLAAQPMISDVIAAIVIFAERRFKIGDVIRLGDDEPARVIGMTWRSTQLKNPDGILVNVPNRKVAEASLHNLTQAGRTFDSLSVAITTQKDPDRVLGVIRKVMEECAYLTEEHGVSVREYTHKGDTKAVKYRFWWFLKDYETRNLTRDEVFSRISVRLADADFAGTEVTLS
jgi:small-conductance mechanosensitive channel